MAAASSPNLDQMTGARAGEHNLLDSKPMGTSEAAYELAMRHNPQEEVDLSQEGIPSPVVFNPMSLTGWVATRGHADTSTLHYIQNLPVSEHGGFVHEGYERVQSFGVADLNCGILEDTACRHEYQHNVGNSSLGNEQHRELLTFPEGEVDAVTITARDLEGLQPMRFLSNNIIDFYIKYLERELPSGDRKRFHFFNSFFFTKLLGTNSASTDIDQCEVDYEQVRNCAGDVNLFEKDYIFIPVLRSSHWSLIIICHLSSLTHSQEKKVSPCIFHLDPVEGMHKGFEVQVRSYIFQACRERYQASSEKDQILLALACQMKYEQAKVPRQDNDYDCGLFVLHYAEVFLHESTSPDFSFASSKWGPPFAEEVSAKRMRIQNLIVALSQISQEQPPRRMDIQPRASVARLLRPQPKRLPKPPKRQNKISKKWSKEETSILLNQLVKGGRVPKGTHGATHWDLISQEIKSNLGSIRSEDECRRRYDTLLKAFKTIQGYIEKTGKPFSDITDEERRKLKLATPLIAEWYKVLDIIDIDKSRKRAKLNPSDGKGLVSLGPSNPAALDPPAPAPIPTGSSKPGKSSRNQVAIPGFSTLDADLRSTLLNLIHASSMRGWVSWGIPEKFYKLDVVCRRLAIVQDREPLEIRRFVHQLWELKLVNIEFFINKEEPFTESVPYLKLSDIRVYKKFVEKVLCKNPDLKKYLRVNNNCDSISFPVVPSSFSLQRIRVLSLYSCPKLEHADLRNFPELRSLVIAECDELNAVTGWEFVKELGLLEIRQCHSYRDFPPVQCLLSLREFYYFNGLLSRFKISAVVDFSQWVRLRRLEVVMAGLLVESMDVSTLRFLEVLHFPCFSTLSTIHGLSGLHLLTVLDLQSCKALRRVPELGCLKALTHLNMSESGVVEISGVQELHLLTRLDLKRCDSLKGLPFLGHLKALVSMDICESGVDEIPGVQDLVSLETLECGGSRLKWLPDLRHLPRLRRVNVIGTPLTKTDPSSSYFGETWLWFDSTEKRMAFDDDISDNSDTEYNHSDDDISDNSDTEYNHSDDDSY